MFTTICHFFSGFSLKVSNQGLIVLARQVNEEEEGEFEIEPYIHRSIFLTSYTSFFLSLHDSSKDSEEYALQIFDLLILIMHT